jgi:hypothetical protein
MIGNGMPMSHNNSPRPMASSCFVLIASRRNNRACRERFRSADSPAFAVRFHDIMPAEDAGCNSGPPRYIARSPIRRGGRVAEGARLESVYTGNRIVGSNPTPSASLTSATVRKGPLRRRLISALRSLRSPARYFIRPIVVNDRYARFAGAIVIFPRFFVV